MGMKREDLVKFGMGEKETEGWDRWEITEGCEVVKYGYIQVSLAAQEKKTEQLLINIQSCLSIVLGEESREAKCSFLPTSE